jgi:septum formation protein
VKNLILASQSPGRKQVLDDANIIYKVVVSNYVENMSVKLKPKDLAIYLSSGKAREVASRVSNSLVIGADSFVVFRGKILGKPHTEEKAVEVLNSLNGKSHDFITGFTIIDSDTNEHYSDSVVTKVYFKNLSHKAILNYIRSDNVLEKAGGYSIQGSGYKLVDKIVGDANNLSGMPLSRVVEVLKQFGYNISLA